MTHLVNDVIGSYLENVIEIEEIKKQFEDIGLDYDDELSKLRTDDVPMIIIKEDQFMIHYDERYGVDDRPLEQLEAIVLEEQFIRALDKQLSCYSIDGKPKVSKPCNPGCDTCTQTNCVVKIRL